MSKCKESPCSCSLQQPDTERVFVAFAVAGFHGGDDHEDDPEQADDRQNQEADQDEAQGEGDGDVNGIADLEVEDFLADGVQQRAFGAFDQPQDQRPDDVAEGEDEPGEAE